MYNKQVNCWLLSEIVYTPWTNGVDPCEPRMENNVKEKARKTFISDTSCIAYEFNTSLDLIHKKKYFKIKSWVENESINYFRL